MAGTAYVTLPNGETNLAPVDPRTWAASERARAKQLTNDVASAVAFHRNRPFFQGLQTIAETSVGGNAWSELTLDWEMIDQWGGHGTSDSFWNVPTTNNDGDPSDFYLVSGYVPVSGSDPSKIAMAGIIKNDTEFREGTKIPLVGSHSIDPMVIDLVGVNDGTDWLGLGVWTNVSAGITTVVSGKCPSLTARWVASSSGFLSPLPPTPHSWISADQITATLTGASPRLGGSKVPLNTEVRDIIRFLNYPPMCRLTSEGQSPRQSIPTGGAWTSIQFPTPNVDNYSGWSSGANTKYTVQRAGLYFVAGYGSINEVSGAGGYRAVRLLVNGTTPYGGMSTVPTTTSTAGEAIYAVRHLRLAAGDTIEVQMSNTGSSAMPVNTAAAGACRLIAVWRGR